MADTRTRPTVLITGASSGIGYELARVFAREGYDLILVARRAQQLTELAERLRRIGALVWVQPCDLTDRSAVRGLYRSVQEIGRPIDVLVNNAGVGDYGSFVSAGVDRVLTMIELNAAALTHLTRLVLPGMFERGAGRVLNVASVAAFQPGPLMAVYYASKAYVLSFSEALAEELAPSGVVVTALCPGPTKSGFQQEAGLHQVPMLNRPGMPTAATVAEFGYRALMRGRRVAVHGALFRLSLFVSRFLPRRLVAATVRRLQERRRVTHDQSN
ncbi:MAG: SDR family oxidoreductase [Spirochaetaceae bacterium]|nr:MAG: SDR family oxidoreductase [Spirochaetaceae bacterium]